MHTIKLLNLYDFEDRLEGPTPNPAAESSPSETLKSPSSARARNVKQSANVEIKCFCIHSMIVLRKTQC